MTTRRMNPEVKSQWIEALRSGRYRQSNGHLKDADGYCCLGVLCDLHDSTLWHNTNHGIQEYGNTHSCYHPPDSVLEWAGMGQENPSVTISCLKEHQPDRMCLFCEDTGTLPTTLSGLNDHYEFDFNQIADVIEEQL